MPERYEAKGLAFLGTLGYAERLDGGRAAVEARMEPAIRARLEDLYVANGWYDVEVLVELMRAVAAVAGVEPEKLIARQAAGAARAAVGGMYRHSMRADSPRAMAERLPRAFSRYFRPCQASLIEARPRSMRASLAPIPERLEHFYRAMNEGFVEGALAVAGAKGARVRWTERRRVDSASLELTFEATWT